MGYGNVVERDGAYNRLADPGWADPLDTAFSKAIGGRWNALGTYGVLYLNNGEPMARAQVAHRLAGQPFAVEDLDPDEQHDLIEVTVAPAQALDCVSYDGLTAAGLPITYPKDATGAPVPHADCHPVGAASHADGQHGIACRSAAAGTAPNDAELALFEDPAKARATMTGRRPFEDWYFGTRLETVLSGLGVGRLVVAGAETDACVRSTLHGAFTRGCDTTLVSDDFGGTP